MWFPALVCQLFNSCKTPFVKICYSVLVGIFLGDSDYLVSLLVSHEHYVGFVQVLEILGKYLNSSLTFSRTGKS